MCKIALTAGSNYLGRAPGQERARRTQHKVACMLFNTGLIDHMYLDSNEADRRFVLHHSGITESKRLVCAIQVVQAHETYNLTAQGWSERTAILLTITRKGIVWGVAARYS